jgi:hypothetical protein
MPNQWHCNRDGKLLGPFTDQQLKQLATSGMLVPTDLIRKAGTEKWVPASRVKGLFPTNEPPATRQSNSPPQEDIPTVLPVEPANPFRFDAEALDSQADKSITTPRLIRCNTCGRDIAVTAEACPKCGALNTWVHPEIQRFLASTQMFNHLPAFRYFSGRFTLEGEAEVKRGQMAVLNYSSKAIAAGVLCLILGAVGSVVSPILILLAIIGPVVIVVGYCLAATGMLQQEKATDLQVKFLVDFNCTPPKWWFNDDEYWREIKDFFFRR